MTEIINRPADPSDINSADVTFYDIDEDFTLDLSDIPTEQGSSYAFGLNVTKPGYYKVTVTASSNLSELAQTSVTVFTLGTAVGTFTFNGTGGKPVSQYRVTPFFSRFTTVRLYFGGSGLKMHSVRFEFVGETDNAGGIAPNL